MGGLSATLRSPDQADHHDDNDKQDEQHIRSWRPPPLNSVWEGAAGDDRVRWDYQQPRCARTVIAASIRTCRIPGVRHAKDVPTGSVPSDILLRDVRDYPVGTKFARELLRQALPGVVETSGAAPGLKSELRAWERVIKRRPGS